MLYEGCVICFLNAVAVVVVYITDTANDRDDGSEDIGDDYELS